MPDDGRKAISDVTSGRARRAPVVVPVGSPVPVRVQLFFEQADGAAPTQADPAIAQELEAGACYHVQITLRRSNQPDAVEIGDDHQISLHWHGGDLELPVTGRPDPVSTAQLQSQGYFRVEFTLDIPEHTPVAEGELLVKARGLGGEPEILRRRKIRIVGRTHAVPKELLENLQLPLKPDTGSELAVLQIGEMTDGIQIIGFHPRRKFTGSFKKLNRSLADVAGQEPSRLVYQAVNAYSQGALRDLLAWLDDVLKQTEEKVSILIMERTDSRVPWEMLVVENQTPPLGARVPVTRWTDVTLYKDTIKLDVAGKVEHRGSVLHFVDGARLAQSRIEVDELLACENVQCRSVDELQGHLEDPPEDMALLFLSCHGTFAQDSEHSTELARDKVAGSGITPLNLVELTTPSKRPAIVVNACHSARIVGSEYGWAGLPNFFLAKYASSYFGALGAVDEQFAAELGRDLIQAARSDHGVNLSQFLFEVRRKAWEKFKGTPHAKRDYWALVSAFMYVLYGPAQNHMQLSPRKAHGR